MLTSTNYEVLQVQSELTRMGIRAKLIQSNDEFRLYNLAEVRFFLKTIDKKLRSPVIDNELWSFAKKQLVEAYAESSCLPNCLNMLSEFEAVNRNKFRTGLDELIKESHYQDFYNHESEEVYISTIHKAKGREFDSVYLLLNNIFAKSDEEKRRLYVAMTRAKESLYIHCNTDIFNKYSVDGVVKREDVTQYDEPLEISLQLTHRDVVLNFFKDKKKVILGLRSGDELKVTDCFLLAEINGRSICVAKFSSRFEKKLNDLIKKGYNPVSAQVGFIVAWRDEEDEESAVLLPTLHLARVPRGRLM